MGWITCNVTGTRPAVVHFPGPSLTRNRATLDRIEAATSNLTLPPDMELVTYCTDNIRSRAVLLHQCQRLGLPLTVLGADLDAAQYQTRGHFWKVDLLHDYLTGGNGKPYLMILDAVDVLLCGDLGAALDLYRQRWPGRVLFSAEASCAYKMARRSKYAISGGDPLAEYRAVRKWCESTNAKRTPWPYLNAGGLIADRDTLTAVLPEIRSMAGTVPDGVYRCDQSLWMYCGMQGGPVSIDHEATVFYTHNRPRKEEITFPVPEPLTDEPPLDVVFLLSSRERDNYSIQVSVASVRRNMTGVRHIWCIGRDPHIPGVRVILFPDPNAVNAEANMTRKLLHACEHPDISDPFIFMGDDTVVLQPVDSRSIPLTWKYPLEKTRGVSGGSKYGRRMRHTLETLRRLQLPTLMYDTHRPTPVNKQAYVQAFRLVDWDNEGPGILLFTLYGNCIGGGVQAHDVKATVKRVHNRNARAVAAALENEQYVSCPSNMGGGLREYLTERFLSGEPAQGVDVLNGWTARKLAARSGRSKIRVQMPKPRFRQGFGR